MRGCQAAKTFSPTCQGAVAPGDEEAPTQIVREGKILFVEVLEGLTERRIAEPCPATDGTAETVGAETIHEEITHDILRGNERASVMEEERGFDGSHVEDEAAALEVAAESAPATGGFERGNLFVKRSIEGAEFIEGSVWDIKHRHGRTPPR